MIYFPVISCTEEGYVVSIQGRVGVVMFKKCAWIFDGLCKESYFYRLIKSVLPVKNLDFAAYKSKIQRYFELKTPLSLTVYVVLIR